MPKKGKKKKGSIRFVEPPLNYKLIPLGEVKENEAKYTQRLIGIKNTLTLIDDAIDPESDVRKKKTQSDEMNEWEDYLRCDGLPDPLNPAQIRYYFEKLLQEENKYFSRLMDWQLSINERSILTQNLRAKDKTRKVLEIKQRPDFGELFSKNIDLTLKVLGRVNESIKSEDALSKTSSRIFNDLLDEKKNIQNRITDAFDRYTYQIIVSENAYMDALDPYTVDYSYEATHFKIHIWAIKNVPMIFKYKQPPSFLADLHKINVQVHLPHVILKDNLVLRGLHLNYDNVSEHAKSYEHFYEGIEDVPAGLVDIFECLLSEWNLQVDILNEIRNKMIQRRRSWEEKEAAKVEEAKKQRREEKNDNKSQKPGKKKIGKEKKKREKKSIEPPVITDNTYPEIWDDFIAKEQYQFERLMNDVLHPDVLKLKEDEVNLKKYAILGGIYDLTFVEKPKHTDFLNDSYTFTLHKNYGKLNVNRNVIIKETDSKFNMDVSTSRTFSSIGLLDTENEDTNVNSPWFAITFQIPDYLCLWGEPIVCLYEPNAIGIIDTIETESEMLAPTNSPLLAPIIASPTSIPSNIQNAPSVLGAYNSSLVYFTSAHSKLKLSSTSSIFVPTISRLNIAENQPVLPIDLQDFRLDQPLTTAQINNLRRHCIPRLISTFQFIREIQNDKKLEDAEEKEQPKEQTGIFGRRTTLQKVKMEQIELNIQSDKAYWHETQTNPERMFPIFQPYDEIIYPNNIDEIKQQANEIPRPKTFFQLISTIDDLKDEYVNASDKIMTVPRFRPELPMLRAKRLMHRLTHLIGMFGSDHQKVEKILESVSKTKIKTRRSTLAGRRSTVPTRHSTLPPRHSNLPTRHSTLSPRRSTLSARQSTLSPRRSTLSSRHSTLSSAAHKQRQHKRRSPSSIKSRSAGSDLSAHRPTEDDDEDILNATSIYSEYYRNEDESDGEEKDDDEEEYKIDIYTEDDDDSKEDVNTYHYSRWTTEYILNSNYDPETHKITIETDRLGIFGLAFKRYTHFPFINWNLQPSVENPDTEFVFTLDTQYVRCIFHITANGYHGYVTDITEGYVKKPVKYLEFNEPIDLKTLKDLLRKKNINIFPDNDAHFYIEDGYHAIKHLASEAHIYKCMALHARDTKFLRSYWNCLAKRRDIVLMLDHLKAGLDHATVRVQPESTKFVEVSELCSETYDIIKLHYKPTWRNFDSYHDLNHAINSLLSEPANVLNDPNLLRNIDNLLYEIRPLSYGG